MDEFKTGKYSTILGKPYLVYDIETTVVDDLKSAKYLLGYAMHPKGIVWNTNVLCKKISKIL